MNPKGKTALITGGAHRVGKAITLGLAQAGANVVINYRSSATAAEETAVQSRTFNVDAHPIQAEGWRRHSLTVGSLSAAIMLYGIAFVYGATGTVFFDEMRAGIGANGAIRPSLNLLLGAVMIFLGLGFKTSAVPLHVWVPSWQLPTAWVEAEPV